MTYQDALLNIDDIDVQNRCCAGRLWFIKHNGGICCATVTWILTLLTEFIVLRIILLPSTYTICSTINITIFHMLVFLVLCSHLRTMLSDPGAVPLGNATMDYVRKMGYREGTILLKCRKCCSFKPDCAHHCSVCQRCIRKMDHHCPWVNNCVGEYNQKYFVLFTFYVVSMSVHVILLIIIELRECVKTEWRQCSPYSPPTTTLLLLFIFFEALTCGFYSLLMLETQICYILNGENFIDELKSGDFQLNGRNYAKKSTFECLQTVFGPPSVTWLSPFNEGSYEVESKSDYYGV